MTVCSICKKEVDWDSVKEEFEHLFQQADGFGMDTLTEKQQVVVEGKICSTYCFEEVD